jgi:hypothetical protein
VIWESKGKKVLGHFDSHLLEILGKRLFGAEDGGVVLDTEVKGCTSVKVNSVKYVAHPMYNNDHPWHDWVYINWSGYDNLYPARIDMFIDLRNANISNVPLQDPDHGNSDVNQNQQGFRHMFLEPKLYAIVWSAKSLDLSRDNTTLYHLPLSLAYRVELEGFRRIVAVESFVKPCFGFLNTCGISRVPFDKTAVVLKEKSEWSDFFLQ